MRLDTTTPFPAKRGPTATALTFFSDRALPAPKGRRRHLVSAVLRAILIFAVMMVFVCFTCLLGILFMSVVKDWDQVWPIILAIALILLGWTIYVGLLYIGVRSVAEGFRDFWHSDGHHRSGGHH